MKRSALGLVALAALLGAFFMALSPHTAGPTIRMGPAGFTPAVVRLSGPGSAVTFSNRSRKTHTATCRGCSLNTGDVQPGLDKTLTFGRAGTYLLLDRYGPGMVSVVVGSGVSSPSPSAS
jgi:plastocyanin